MPNFLSNFAELSGQMVLQTFLNYEMSNSPYLGGLAPPGYAVRKTETLVMSRRKKKAWPD